jgi:hypothetical protein
VAARIRIARSTCPATKHAARWIVAGMNYWSQLGRSTPRFR